MDSMLDNINPRGEVTVQVMREGREIQRTTSKNMVVNTGRDRIAALIAEDSTALPSHIAVGTGTTAVSLTDTAMESEVERNAFTTKTSSSGVATFKAFFSKSDANGSTLTEVGLFDQSSGGTMFCHAILGVPVVKTSSDSVIISWTLTFADA
jgi:hypothetical protein